MSSMLLFLVPIGLLAVAWSLCFAGCVFQTSGIPGTPYSNIVLGESGLIAYWPLGDLPNAQPPAPPPPPPPPPLSGSTSPGSALDLTANKHTGTYTIPPPYPSGAQAVQFSKPFMNPDLQLRLGSIVPGDVSNSSQVDQNLLPGSTAFAGGYVSVPWSTQNPPLLDQFTLEAWILPGWTGSGFFWVVFSAYINNTGFRLFINDLNHWEVVVGTGPGNTPVSIDTMVLIDPTSTTATYVALTCDTAGNMQLWIDPENTQSDTDTPPPPPPPNWTSPQSTGYAAIGTGQPVTFFIGAGANDFPIRTPTANPQGAPLYPFQGKIQDVALYYGVLDPTKIQNHYITGS